jgi:type II secretory pathway component GspD/PulD (secretin)
MQFGETLVLGGLSEKEDSVVRDGVPILQDVPVLQYFFSNEQTVDFHKSVLILITPRRAHRVSAPGADYSAPPPLPRQERVRTHSL